jgi:S1-C subfamily serine protease
VETPAAAAKKAWLGIEPDEIGDETRSRWDLEDGVGLAVARVVEGSPAEKAGLKENDLLMSLNGKKVSGEDFLAKFMEDARAGDVVDLQILRKGKPQTVKVTLAVRR